MTSFVTGALGTILKELDKSARRFENRKMSKDHPNYNIIDIVQYSEKSTEDFCHPDSSEKPSLTAGTKNSQGLMMIIIIMCQELEEEEHSPSLRIAWDHQ